MLFFLKLRYSVLYFYFTTSYKSTPITKIPVPHQKLRILILHLLIYSRRFSPVCQSFSQEHLYWTTKRVKSSGYNTISRVNWNSLFSFLHKRQGKFWMKIKDKKMGRIIILLKTLNSNQPWWQMADGLLKYLFITSPKVSYFLVM